MNPCSKEHKDRAAPQPNQCPSKKRKLEFIGRIVNKFCKCLLVQDSPEEPIEPKTDAQASPPPQISPPSPKLLPPQPQEFINKKTLVLDMDETLLHVRKLTDPSDPDKNAVLSVRPGLEEFLKEAGENFEVVVFTAGQQAYADPILDIIDSEGLIANRLYRDSCEPSGKEHIKDLSKLGRDLSQVIIVDNTPTTYERQPLNAIPVASWYNDNEHDKELSYVTHILRKLSLEEDVTDVLGVAHQQGVSSAYETVLALGIVDIDNEQLNTNTSLQVLEEQ